MKTNSTLISLSTLLVAMLGLPLMLGEAQASTTGKLANCKANSKQKVIACCEKTIEDHKRPYWMAKGPNACSVAVVCAKSTKLTLTHVSAPTLVCYVSVPQGGQGSGTAVGAKQPTLNLNLTHVTAGPQ